MTADSFLKNVQTGLAKKLASFFTNKNSKADLNWFRIKYLKHLSPGKKRSFTLRGKKIYHKSPSEFLHTLRELFVEEIYDIDLPRNAHIIDCGANIGLSVIYLKMRFPDSSIIAFEPDSDNYSLLEENIRSFDLKNIEARKEAVWIRDEILVFSNEGTMGSKISDNSDVGVKVRAVRLRNLLLRKVDFLKIDIEGAEYQVIKDIATELKNVSNLFVEYHGKFEQNKELNEMLSLLANAGFKFYLKEAAEVYKSPFMSKKEPMSKTYDLQLNIFCFR
jgi:FkbM family methyltransferase